MKIEIEYCSMWNYKPEAVRVAAEIKQVSKAKITLTEGERGIFDVKQGGKLLYSKAKTGTFPTPNELDNLVQ